jgi:hypothetical protein
LVLFGSLGFVGYSLGVIRTGFSLIGLLVASLLAWPMGHFFDSPLGLTGLKNPIIIWLLGPVVVFCIILIVFKVIGMIVHRKVDVYYKYKAGDLKMGLWTRLSARLGLFAGLANAAVYLILICTVIYMFSYTTYQMANGPEAPWLVKLLNTAGKNLEETGMNKVAAAIDPLPEKYYQTVDIIGLIYHNDLLEGRLSRYPAFLAMGEKPEFQDIAKDKQFTEMRQRQAPISEILDYPKAQNIVNNPDMLKEIWGIVAPNLVDIKEYLLTGKSAKYDEPILGRWVFNLGRAIFQFKQNNPNIRSAEMKLARGEMSLIYSKTTLIAATAPDKQAFLNNIGKIRVTPAPKGPANKPPAPPTISVDMEKFKGHWDGEDGKYELTFPDRKRKLKAVVEGDRMTITGDQFPMVFERDY